MDKHKPSREEAWNLLIRYNDTESLINHALSVEAVMRHFARLGGGDEEMWGTIGLAHDLDYEKYPEQHCAMTKKILEEEGWDDDYIKAILSHGWGIVTDIIPESTLEKTLFAIDELTGLITACALVRPSKSVMDLTVSSVKKKWKMKAFAAGANREVIAKGAEMLGMELDSLIFETIEGMKTIAPKIGL